MDLFLSYDNLPQLIHVLIDPFVPYIAYCTARKVSRDKIFVETHSTSFYDFIFTNSDPIAIINDVNIVSWIKIFAGRDKSTKTTKILPHKTF